MRHPRVCGCHPVNSLWFLPACERLKNTAKARGIFAHGRFVLKLAADGRNLIETFLKRRPQTFEDNFRSNCFCSLSNPPPTPMICIKYANVTGLSAFKRENIEGTRYKLFGRDIKTKIFRDFVDFNEDLVIYTEFSIVRKGRF